MASRGMLYKQTYKDKAGTRRETSTWWMQYYLDGRRIREGTETTDR